MCHMPWCWSDLPDIVTRMDLRGWGVRVVVVSAVAVLAVGCSADPDVVVTPTPTITAPVVDESSPTPSPSPTELTQEEILAAIPEEALAGDFFSAVYFSQFFVEM